jgi:hypothetical protein
MSLAPRSRKRSSEPAQPKTWGTKKCKNCDRKFIKSRKNQEFCKTAPDGTASQCKAEFYRNRSAFGPLKGRIEGMIREHTKHANGAMRALSIAVAKLSERLDAVEATVQKLEKVGTESPASPQQV